LGIHWYIKERLATPEFEIDNPHAQAEAAEQYAAIMAQAI
jgi:hypothetical protein